MTTKPPTLRCWICKTRLRQDDPKPVVAGMFACSDCAYRQEHGRASLLPPKPKPPKNRLQVEQLFPDP